MTQLEQLQQMVDRSRRIVFFGGAGVSCESGIPDFRSGDGLYQERWPHPPETMLSHEFFFSHTEEFYRFYRQKMLFPNARPNAAHRKLAQLEAAGKLTAVITQNIDGLHQAAGSRQVYELHGSVHRNRCLRCKKAYSLQEILQQPGVPRCSCGGLIKPEVVLYGEGLDEATVEGAIHAISRADLLLIGGTSLVVWPAAGFIDYFKGEGLVILNRTPTPADHRADLLVQENIGVFLSGLRV